MIEVRVKARRAQEEDGCRNARAGQHLHRARIVSQEAVEGCVANGCDWGSAEAIACVGVSRSGCRGRRDVGARDRGGGEEVDDARAAAATTASAAREVAVAWCALGGEVGVARAAAAGDRGGGGCGGGRG